MGLEYRIIKVPSSCGGALKSVRMDENLSTSTFDQESDGEGIDQRSKVAHGVYLEISKSFYTWERESISQILAGLPRSHAKRKRRQIPRPTYDVQNQEEGEKISFVLEGFTSSSHTAFGIRRTHKYRIVIEPIIPKDGPYEPYPRYTACTPISANLSGPSDPHLRASFAPFADDARFELESYLANFEDFAWQNEFPDPDCICTLISIQ